MTIHLRTLGQIDLRDDAGAELRSLLTQPKRLAVLVYLAGTATSRMCRRDTLMAMFWPESDEERARAALRQALHFIRQAAGDVVVTRGVEEIGLQPDSVWLDATELDRAASEARHEDALGLYGGDFLSGFFVRGAPEFERWAEGERTRLRRRAADSAWALVEERLERSDTAGARAVAEQAVRLSPDSEVAVRRFIELLALSGDHSAAATVYQDFAAELAAEFGIQPSPETAALIATLGKNTPPRAMGAVPMATVSVSAPTSPAVSQTRVSPPNGTSAPAEETVVSGSWNPSSAVPPRRSRFGVRAWIAVGTIGTLVLGIAMRSAFVAERVDVDDRRVAVMPFVVSGSPALNYLHDGLPLLIGTRLDGAGGLRAVDQRAILLDQSRHGADSLSPNAADATAQRFGARLYVSGSVVGTPDALHIDVSLYDRRRGARPIARTQVDGREADIVKLVDDATTKLLADRFRDDNGLVAEMAARTTGSFVALKAWLDGESWMAQGRYEPATASFRAAIAADSNFAMAYYRLAVAAAWAGNLELVGPAAHKAVELSDRLPPYARTITRAFLNSRTGRYAEAEHAERALLAERPASIDVWFDLAELLYHGNPGGGRSIAEARTAFEQMLRMDPHNFAALVHLSRLAADRNDATALDSLTQLALQSNPDGTHRVELLLLRTLGLNDASSRRELLEHPANGAVLDALWRAAEYTGNLKDAESVASVMVGRTSERDMRASFFLFLAHDAIGRERFADASRYLDSLSQYAPAYGAVSTSLAALHPAAGRARGALLSQARQRFDASAARSGRAHVYIGSMASDSMSAFWTFERARLRAATGTAADSAAARALTTSPASHDGAAPMASVLLQLENAADDETASAALRRMAWLDSLYGNTYAPQTPLLPRAMIQLAALPLLERAGRNADALARLETVPEDFGFNIAYLAEVHRRRAALFDATGQPDRAAAERAIAQRIVQ